MSEFKLLPAQEKAALLYNEGVYIGKRRECTQVVLLYQLEEFYVELFYAKYRHHIYKTRCSASTLILEPYLDQIEVEVPGMLNVRG
jgi:hypothetical protein